MIKGYAFKDYSSGLYQAWCEDGSLFKEQYFSDKIAKERFPIYLRTKGYDVEFIERGWSDPNVISCQQEYERRYSAPATGRFRE